MKHLTKGLLMKKLIGGAISVVLGIIGFTTYFPEFVGLLTGTIPIVLILAGALVIYLNYDNDSSGSDDGENSENSEPEVIEIEPVEPETSEADLVESVDVAKNEGSPNFLGNSNSLVFHKPNCKFAQNIKKEVTFNTKEEAIEKEYKPCGVCKP